MAVAVGRQPMHVKKGDTVEVIAGKNRGKRGKVLKVFPKPPPTHRGGRDGGEAPRKADAEAAAGWDRGERGQDPGEQGDAGLPQVRGGGALRARPPARRDQGASLPQLRRADWITGAARGGPHNVEE